MAEGTIGLAEPSTITKSLRSVTQNINSSVVHQEVMTLGGAGSSLQLAAVLATAPPSTTFGLVVRIAGGPSSAADYTPVRIVNSSGDGFATIGVDYTDASTTSTLVAPSLSYVNGSNTTMRVVGTTQPLPVQLRTGSLAYDSTTVQITSTNSTAVYALVSSQAAAIKVYAIHVTSTHTRPSTIVFMSSLASDIWAGLFGTGSSGVSGFNFAVTPPAFLFKTAVNESLRVRIEDPSTAANSTTVARISLSFFAE